MSGVIIKITQIHPFSQLVFKWVIFALSWVIWAFQDQYIWPFGHNNHNCSLTPPLVSFEGLVP